MNYIVMADTHISAFTNTIEADTHKHWMVQVFLSLDKPFDITIEGEPLNSGFLIIDKNVEHCFSSRGELCFTMLIEPTSNIANLLKCKYLDNEKRYAVLNNVDLTVIQNQCLLFLKDKNAKNYFVLLNNLFNLLCVKILYHTDYDERILRLFKFLDECDCSEHSMRIIAEKLYLSSSRMAHLFKEQTGIPLKSYIVLHKLQSAYSFLLIDKKNITDAAMLAGFDSPSHLSSTNKSMTGMNLTNVLKYSDFLKVESYRRV